MYPIKMQKKKSGDYVTIYNVFHENGVNYATFWDNKMNGFINLPLKQFRPLPELSNTTRNSLARRIEFHGEAKCTDGATFPTLSEAITHEAALYNEITELSI